MGVVVNLSDAKQSRTGISRSLGKNGGFQTARMIDKATGTNASNPISVTARLLANKSSDQRKNIYNNLGLNKKQILQTEKAAGFAKRIEQMSAWQVKEKLNNKGIYLSSIKDKKGMEEAFHAAKIDSASVNAQLVSALLKLGARRRTLNLGQVKGATQLLEARAGKKSTSIGAPADSSRLGIEGIEYQNSVNTSAVSSQRFRGGNIGSTASSGQLGKGSSASAFGSVSNKATSIAGSHGKNAAGIGGGIGQKKSSGAKIGGYNSGFKLAA